MTLLLLVLSAASLARKGRKETMQEIIKRHQKENPIKHRSDLNYAQINDGVWKGTSKRMGESYAKKFKNSRTNMLPLLQKDDNSLYQGQNSLYQGQNSQYRGQNSQYRGQNSQYRGQSRTHQGQNRTHQGQDSQLRGQSKHRRDQSKHRRDQSRYQPDQDSQLRDQSTNHQGQSWKPKNYSAYKSYLQSKNYYHPYESWKQREEHKLNQMSPNEFIKKEEETKKEMEQRYNDILTYDPTKNW